MAITRRQSAHYVAVHWRKARRPRRRPSVPAASPPAVPNLESGNMLAKNLAYFAKADSAGIVLGAFRSC
jgi:hypothetical protein